MTAEQFFVTAVPVFLAAVLGVATGFFTDWLKTRRENRKVSRERQEKELTQLNSAATAMGYNIEALLHIVMQQVLPHHERSHAALPQYAPQGATRRNSSILSKRCTQNLQL